MLHLKPAICDVTKELLCHLRVTNIIMLRLNLTLVSSFFFHVEDKKRSQLSGLTWKLALRPMRLCMFVL